MDIVVWLRSLGLGNNDIDDTVLLTLTAEDLKELGVTSLGHRRKLLDAIAALRDDASVQTPSVEAAPARPSAATPIAAPVAEAVGERRHITVMFCDLVEDEQTGCDLRSAYRLTNRPLRTSFVSYARSRTGEAGRSSTSIMMPALADRRGGKPDRGWTRC
jgi:hypothetical protein